jgi:restriction system protein
MSIPDFQSVMLPLLALASDGDEHLPREAADVLAKHFALSDTERAELLPSGMQPVFNNRIGWARTFLKQAGLLDSPRRGVFKITDDGKKLLAEKPTRIDMKLLERYESYRAFRLRGKRANASATVVEELPSETPEDAMAAAYQRLRAELESELLEQVMAASPAFFEKLVVDLLLAMGYGGSRRDAGRAIGQSGDGGIDGVINEDRLGLDVIYLQAKRWEGTVGRPEIQKFAGALQGQRAAKGVFITTSTFSKDAVEYANRIPTKIILLDGDTLVSYMFDYGVGVSRTGGYEIKRLDTDYFDPA